METQDEIVCCVLGDIVDKGDATMFKIIGKYHKEARIDLSMKENYLLMAKNYFLLYDSEDGYEQFELGVHYLTLAVQAIELENILYTKPNDELN